MVATWTERLGDRAEVLTREAAIRRGWFGPVDASVLPRLGDVVVACRGDHAVISTTDFPYETTLVGPARLAHARRDADPAPRRLSPVRRYWRTIRGSPLTSPVPEMRQLPPRVAPPL